MKLNGRLAMIAGRIPHCRILSDIGTDHAYIPIYAVEKGLCTRSLAADLRAGPLKMAEANIRRHGLEKYIETRIGNGLEPVSLEECDVVVIAGMGGSLIKDILSGSLEKAQKAELLLLQPNNAADVLRKWLYENGFEIEREMLAIDAGKLYGLICAKWTGMTKARDAFDYYIGDMLLKSGDPNICNYIRKKIKELDVVIAGRLKSRTYGSASSAAPSSSSADDVREGSLAKGEKANGISVIAGLSTEGCRDIRSRLGEFLEKNSGSGSAGKGDES